MPQFISLPFSIANVYQGFAEANGIAKANEAGLILEFQVKDGLMGVFKSPIKEVQIPINEIFSVELQVIWFVTRLIIRTKSIAILSDVPGSKAGQIALWIARKDRQVARELVSVLRLSMTQKELDSLNQEIAQLGDAGI
ncbi:hypothetical protein [Scytonema sp. PCC 10023]|uniref:hypothetical protein n=1 Tax=Scytonema sp. PCC 10023 TaxID=1680591 RepID=UPI0039C6799F